jgi:hypothetical protein
MRVVAELSALVLSHNDRHDRDGAVWYLQAARHELAEGDYERAIDKLLSAVEKLRKITSANVAPQRADTARILQEAEIRWAAAQP